MNKCISALLFAAIVLFVSVPAKSPGSLMAGPTAKEIDSPSDTCWADADVNNDGMVLTVADYVYLVRYLAGEEQPLPVPYKADLNGDCIVDQLDADVYDSYFINGLPAFAPYGGYPVLTCCYPDTVIGACCVVAECRMLGTANCELFTGLYKGDGIRCAEVICDTCAIQLPGDINGDAAINVGDLVYYANYFYKGGPGPVWPYANADPTGDCLIDMEDLFRLYCYLGTERSHGLPVECTCLDPQLGQINSLNLGDANGDEAVNIGDAVYIINHIFKGGPLPIPYRVFSGDANCDYEVNVGDAVFIIGMVFQFLPQQCSAAEWLNNAPCFHPNGYWIE